MNKSVSLEQVAQYSKKRIRSENVSIQNYITIDNILQNKAGITMAVNLPPQGDTMPAFNSGNILVGNIRPYLKKIWYADREGGCSADVLVIEVNKKYHPKYVYYALFRDDFFDHMMRGKKGTKMPRGDKDQILDFLIPDFEYSKQQKIATILSTIDSKIELNKRINTELEAMAKTLYDYWFVQFDFPDAKGRPYKSSGGKMVWNEELKREIPEGWGVGKISNIVDNIKNLTNESENIHLPYIPIDNLPKKKLISADFSPNIEAKSSLVLFKKYDILLGAMRVYFHRVCLAIQDGITRTTTFILRSKEDHFKYYALFTINSDESITFATINSKGSTIPYTFWEKGYENYSIVIPSKELLQIFNKIISPIIEKSIINEKESQQLSSLRDWLLPMLMNGQVRVG